MEVDQIEKETKTDERIQEKNEKNDSTENIPKPDSVPQKTVENGTSQNTTTPKTKGMIQYTISRDYIT